MATHNNETPNTDSEQTTGEETDVYRDDRTYDKCKWERAWGELNAALHADLDAQNFISGVSRGNPEKISVIKNVIDVFDEIADKHNVESYDECWDGDVEECSDHSATPP